MLNILQLHGQLLTTQAYLVQNVNGAEVGTHVFTDYNSANRHIDTRSHTWRHAYNAGLQGHNSRDMAIKTNSMQGKSAHVHRST